MGLCAIRLQADKSEFIKALNSYQETFPGISYTVAYTHLDEVVVPNLNEQGSSALHGGGGAITNVAVQQICPLDVSEHLAIGTYDPVAYAIAIDALSHPACAEGASAALLRDCQLPLAGSPRRMSQSATVAVLGAGGTLGLPMARNMAKAGIDVRAWNRTRAKAESLADVATVLDSPADAVSGADVILTILSDADAVLSTMEGSGAKQGAIWLQMSTIGIEGTERCATLADQHELVLVDAPVVGTKQPAEQGKLTVLASGPDHARERCEPIFDAVAQKVLWLGESGTGTRMKLVINSWLLSLVEGLGETIAFAEGIDIDPAQFLETISGGPIDNAYAQMKGKMMIERSFEPAFKLGLAAKDAGLVLEAAERHDLDLPMLEAIRDQLGKAAEEHGEKDMAATYLASAPKDPAGR